MSAIVKDDWTNCEKNIKHLKNQKDIGFKALVVSENMNKLIWGKKYILNNFCASNLHQIVQKWQKQVGLSSATLESQV